jgi:2-dehydro-3-deoxy-D-arabinonate dehydratase
MRTVGPGVTIRTRADGRWNVPEPELGVVIGEDGEPVAVAVANDVSSRDIEGANPLCIPQAKIFAGGCAIGAALAVPDDWHAPWTIALGITDDRQTRSSPARRRPRRCGAQRASWSHGSCATNLVPAGSVVLTGTGLMPEDDYTLLPGHRVEITINGIGTLVNTVGGAA